MSAEQILMVATMIALFAGGFACGSRPASAGTGPKGGIDPDRGLQPARNTPVMPPVRRAPPAPPPAHIAEHARDCPVYREWERSMRCDHCGNLLSEKPEPEPPTSSRRKEGTTRTGPL